MNQDLHPPRTELEINNKEKSFQYEEDKDGHSISLGTNIFPELLVSILDYYDAKIGATLSWASINFYGH